MSIPKEKRKEWGDAMIERAMKECDTLYSMFQSPLFKEYLDELSDDEFAVFCYQRQQSFERNIKLIDDFCLLAEYDNSMRDSDALFEKARIIHGVKSALKDSKLKDSLVSNVINKLFR